MVLTKHLARMAALVCARALAKRNEPSLLQAGALTFQMVDVELE